MGVDTHLKPRRIAARYIGERPLTLAKEFGPYEDGHGERITTLVLSSGDTLLMPETEVRGQTFLEDPRREKDPRWLGAGRVLLPQDQGKSEAELGQLGYAFQEGRPDFEPVADEAGPSEVTGADLERGGEE